MANSFPGFSLFGIDRFTSCLNAIKSKANECLHSAIKRMEFEIYGK